MARQLEEPHNANDAEELKYVVVLLQVIQQEVKVETERCDEIDNVDRSEAKRALAWTDHKPDVIVNIMSAQVSSVQNFVSAKYTCTRSRAGMAIRKTI